MMNWAALILAGILEIVWAVYLKYSSGFSKGSASVIAVIAMILSIWLLSYAMKTLPLGISYAVWTGIGIMGTALFGMLWLGESASAMKVICIALILMGTLGLSLSR